MRFLLYVAAFALVFPVYAHAGKVKLDSQDARVSYALGLQIGQGLKQDGVPIDIKAFSMAIEDVLAGKEPQLSTEDMQAALTAFQQQQVEARAAMGSENIKKGKAFMAVNGKKDGVTQTDSGIQYRVLAAGSGKKKPGPTDSVTVHYKGTLINGEEFDSSYSRGEPATFPLNRVIQGWQQIMPMMVEGAKWEVVIPADLAYGERGSQGGIGPHETLVFEIELITVN